jgi:hypothetical protein
MLSQSFHYRAVVLTNVITLPSLVQNGDDHPVNE